jgi:chromate transporter
MLKLIAIYLRFGVLGFGGPFALVAMMQEELVEKRRWIPQEKFLQAFSMIKVLPGATATQLAIYIAHYRAGRLGGALAGVAFILPSALAVLLLSIFYVKANQTAHLSALFQGMQIGALVVIADSVVKMAKPYWRSRRAAAIATVAGAMIFWDAGLEPFLIMGFGLIGILKPASRARAIGLAPALAPTMKLALICLKTGFLVFGTGLAIIPVLEADIVTKQHWLTHAEFLDGLALGQITPGPVSTTATFIGYKVAGLAGAFWATVAIFTSAFFNILVLLPLVEHRLKGSPKLKAFTDWAFPAVIGGIAATSLSLGLSTVTTAPLLFFLLLFVGVLFKWHPPAWAFIPLSGVVIFVASHLN